MSGCCEGLWHCALESDATHKTRAIARPDASVVKALCREHGKLVGRSTGETERASERVEGNPLVGTSVDASKVDSLLPIDEDPDVVCTLGDVEEETLTRGVDKVRAVLCGEKVIVADHSAIESLSVDRKVAAVVSSALRLLDCFMWERKGIE